MVRTRMVALVLGATAVVAGCSSSSKSSSSSSSPGVTSAGSATTVAVPAGAASGFCGRLVTTAAQLQNIAPSAGSSPAAYKSALEKVAVAFSALETDAPSDVKAAITDLVAVIRAGENALTDPSAANAQAVQDLQTKLPADTQTITSYLTAHCGNNTAP